VWVQVVEGFLLQQIKAVFSWPEINWELLLKKR